jgi:hypothetical protein
MGYVIEGGTGPGLSNLGVVQLGDVTMLITNARRPASITSASAP